MLGRLLTVYGALNRTFGFSIKPLFTFWLYISFRTFATFTLWLDHLFFPGFKKVKLDRPVFIIGTPRSGTTFLHRFLEEHWSLACFQVWQMIMPSITGQKLLRPFIKPLARFNPARHHASHAHETGLDAVETDDALLSVRFIDGFFLYAWFLAWDDREHPRIFETLEADAPEVHRDLSFYTTCLKRNIHGSGKERVLGKPFIGTMRIESMLNYFPDARFI
ncbi:MAG: sulfotransferase, partial [Myxococcota bacterium]|nr:sulfotransferase [Myxococcota bacterium]